MPNHKTHDKIGLVVTPVLAAVSVYSGQSLVNTTALVTGFLLSTYYLSPDLDLNSRIYHRWGLLRFIWFPYQKLIKHRSWLSHSGPVSATIRLLYLMIFLYPMIMYWGLQFTPICVIIWLSVILADTVHTASDYIWKGG